MKHVGWILFAAGSILGISGAAKVPAKVGGWPDSLPIFLVGATLAVVGLFLWRRGLRHEVAATLRKADAAEGPDALGLLNGVVGPTEGLAADIEELDAAHIMERVDTLLQGYLLPFAEVRRNLIDRFGMATGAEILVTVAYGERMLNRVWSAASDDHLPEARASLPEALDALHEAQRMVEAAQSA